MMKSTIAICMIFVSSLYPFNASAATGCFVETCHWLYGCSATPHGQGAIDRHPDGSVNPRPIIDFYFDNSFVNANTVFSLDRDVAEENIKGMLLNFQSQSGGSFQFRFAGYGAPNHYAVDTPMLIIRAIDDPANECQNANAAMCALGVKGANEMSAGLIWIPKAIGPFNDQIKLFRESFLHEVMHTLRFEHQDDPSCAAGYTDDFSAVGRPWNTSEYLTLADKRNIRLTYGYSEQTVRWRRSQPFATYNWSAPTTIISEATTTPVAVSGGDVTGHGFVFTELTGNTPRLRGRFHEGGSWSNVEQIGNLNSYHRADVVFGDDFTDRWMVAALVNDTRETQPQVVVAKRTVDGAGWTVSAPSPIGNQWPPHVAMTFDPLTGYYVVATVDDVTGRLQLQTVNGGNLAWGTARAETNSIGLTRDRLFGGVDIACSPSVNQATGRNCIAVGRTRGDSNDQSRTVYIPFSVYANGSNFLWGGRTFKNVMSHTIPQVSVDPKVTNGTQFVYVMTRGSSIGEWRKAVFREQTVNQWIPGGITSQYLAAVNDRQFLPFALGTHRANNRTYNDLGYSLDY